MVNKYQLNGVGCRQQGVCTRTFRSVTSASKALCRDRMCLSNLILEYSVSCHSSCTMGEAFPMVQDEWHETPFTRNQWSNYHRSQDMPLHLWLEEHLGVQRGPFQRFEGAPFPSNVWAPSFIFLQFDHCQKSHFQSKCTGPILLVLYCTDVTYKPQLHVRNTRHVVTKVLWLLATFELPVKRAQYQNITAGHVTRCKHGRWKCVTCEASHSET